MLRVTQPVLLLALTSAAFVGCNAWQTPNGAADSGGMGSTGENGGMGGLGNAPVTYAPDPAGLHVEGNQIKDATGTVIALHGINRSGTEYSCVNGVGIFDGPSDDASIQVMTTWNANAVRVPLNESCWPGINGVRAALAGDNYKTAILAYVNLLHKNHLTPILELHWTADGTKRAGGQQPMPDADHAPALWTDVANTFLADTGVVFELFNEPFPDSNHDTDAAWACWRDGCIISPKASTTGVTPDVYEATGMQSLVTAVRDTGATQLILLGGVEYSNALTQWQKYKPSDPLNNLAVAWHVYNFNGCNNADCWKQVLSAPAALGQLFPIVATEIGENDCNNTFVNPLMQALDAVGGSYLAWSWNSASACVAATQDSNNRPWALITDYGSGVAPSPYAQAIKDHFLASTP